jgi:outer membrane protein assembly factor BamD
MLARHELYVARFYANEDEFQAAMSRVQYAMRTYQATGLEPEAVVLLGEIYLKMKQPNKAAALFNHVLVRYPDSAFTEPARRFLEQMGEKETQRAAGPEGMPL